MAFFSAKSNKIEDMKSIKILQRCFIAYKERRLKSPDVVPADVDGVVMGDLAVRVSFRDIVQGSAHRKLKKQKQT